MNPTELLQKVVDTTLLGSGGGGILNPEQANRFIDYLVDETVLVKDARVIRMNAPTREIDVIDIGQRIARKATENTDDHVNAEPTFDKVTLNTVKIRLDWKLTSEALEDNIERDNLEDHIARLMATALARDLEDLYINGDTTSLDPLLMSLDGWRKIALAEGHVVSPDDPTDGLTKEVFNKALKNMPNKYLQRRVDLRWYTGSSMIQDFLAGLSDRATGLGDAIIFGGPPGGAPTGGGAAGGMTNIRPYGIPLLEIPLFSETLAGTYSGATGNHGYLELTFPYNRLIGIQREIKVYREFKPKVDAIEYTVFTRVAAQVENPDAMVLVKDIKIL